MGYDLGLVVGTSRAFGDTHGAEGRRGGLRVEDQRDGVDGVGGLPAGRVGDNDAAVSNGVVVEAHVHGSLGFIDNDGNEVVVGVVGVTLHHVVKDHVNCTIAVGARRGTKVHDASIAERVDVGEVDNFGTTRHGVRLSDLLGDGVATAHRFGLLREERAKLLFAEVGAQLSQRTEEVALDLLSLRVGVVDFEGFSAEHVLIVHLAASHSTGTTFETADDGVLSFHGLDVFEVRNVGLLLIRRAKSTTFS